MTRIHTRPRTLFFAALTGALLIGAKTPGAQTGPPGGNGLVYAAEVDAVIHPVSAGFMIDTIDRANADGAALVVFTLRTPGGLVDATRDIIARMLSSTTPVAVLIAPAGARAASAGFIIAIAADLVAMAPGTHLGAAHPVSGSGQPVNEVTDAKATQDIAAYVRTLATSRQRNVKLAEEAVVNSRAFTEREALAASPPLIDLLAADVRDLLEQLDGRPVRRFDGSSTTLATDAARIVTVEMNWRQRILSAIAHPNIAYLLLSLGMLGLTIELWSPGAIVPGVAGGLSLLLAFFALQLLPVNYAGVLLVALGLLLFLLEFKVASYGLLTVAGAVSLLLGSMMLFDSPAPELRVSMGLVVPAVAGMAAIAAILVRLGVAAQRQSAVTGAAGMIGLSGQAVTDLAPGAAGRVLVRGENWGARANETIAQGARVRVLGIEGLTLTVGPET